MTTDEIVQCLSEEDADRLRRMHSIGNKTDLRHTLNTLRMKYDDTFVVKGPVGSGKSKVAKDIMRGDTYLELTPLTVNFVDWFDDWWYDNDVEQDWLWIDGVIRDEDLKAIVARVESEPKLCKVVITTQSIDFESELCTVLDLRKMNWSNFKINHL